MRFRRAGILISCAALALVTVAQAEDSRAGGVSSTNTTELQQLRHLLTQQQRQIEALRAALEEQKKVLERLAGSPPAGTDAPKGDGLIASTAPLIPAVAAPAARRPAGPLPQLPATTASPLQLQIGNTTITPVGFMDLTASWKDKNAGGSLGSNFGSIPYNNATAARLSEFRFSPQNSRIGFRVDGDWKGAHFLAYNEFDFLGTSGSNAISVTNGAFVPRLRLFWVNVSKGPFEFLAGQSWSMLTPNRKGISALPGDLFYSQVVDVNYVIGLPWTRQAGVRVLYHPARGVTVGFSAENPNQYIGGSGGGPIITLPAAPSPLNGLGGSQLDTTANAQTIPNVHPDFIAKLAFDPSSRAHLELAGIERTFKIWNPATGQYSTKAGGGGSMNGNFEVVKNFRLITNSLWGDGIGRYFFGNAPDLIVRANGEVSPIHAGGWIEGFEATARNTLLYGYYSGIYIRRNTAFDTNGTSLMGYGYRGAPNIQNKTVQELTFGFTQTFWKDAKYGALSLMGQWAWLFRNPWYLAPNSPKGTHDNTIFVNIRYTLPGSAPSPKIAGK